jgi:hypothetical protein
VAEIEVDPDEIRARAVALQSLSDAVHSARPCWSPPDCGDPLADAAVSALLEAVRNALPAVAVELTTVSTIVARAARLYERVDAAVARD